MNDDETRAATLLDLATSDLTPDVDRLVAGGISRGRAQRRRRRVGTTLAAVAVIGVTGAAASVLPGGGAGHGRDRGAVASEPPAHRTPVASALASLLPHGRVTALADERGRGFDRGGLLYRGTRVYIYVYRATSCETAPLLVDVGCYDLDAGATRPRSVAGTETSADGLRQRRRSEADLTRPDGWRVSVVATNDREAGGRVVRRVPSLGWAQLLRIARADVWLAEPQ